MLPVEAAACSRDVLSRLFRGPLRLSLILGSHSRALPMLSGSRGTMRPFRMAVLIALVLVIAGCALPPAFTIASFVADGISMASSGKTVTDQAISFLAQKDCRLWRLVQGKSICGSEASVVAVAVLPPALPLRAASPALRAPEPNVGAAAAPAEAPVAEPAPMPSMPSPAAVPAAPSPAATASGPAPAAAAPTGGTSRPKIATAPAAPAGQATLPAALAAPAERPPMRHSAGDASLRGEMIIRSGTDEAEARALAESLHAVGATVRPVRHGDITIYEVVMGLSG